MTKEPKQKSSSEKTREESVKYDFKRSFKTSLRKSMLEAFYDPRIPFNPIGNRKQKQKFPDPDAQMRDLSPDPTFLHNLVGQNETNFDLNDEALNRISSTTYIVDNDSTTSSVKSRIDFFESKSRDSKTNSEDSLDDIDEILTQESLKNITTALIAYKKRDKFMKKYLKPTKSNIHMKINQFSLMCTIGRGSFGRVLLAYHKVNNRFYAVKVLNKEKLVKNNQIDHTINERNILYSCDHPNIIKLYTSFKDNSYIYFITDLHCHSDLYSLLKRSRGFGEEQSRFYAANIFLALEYLHINDVIYRDLKPENILITSNGYLKLTDFGFAKRINGYTTTMCGTPDYISPEVLSSMPYGKSADWWAFGVFIFELNSGIPPFCSPETNDTNALYELIQKGSFEIPKNFTAILSDICQRLIQKEVSKRLGCLKRGSSDIRDHIWFDQVDWIGIYKQTFPSPYVPKPKEPLDIAFKNPNKKEDPLKISKINQYKNEFIDF